MSINDCVVDGGFVQYADGAVIDGAVVNVSAAKDDFGGVNLGAVVTVSDIPITGLDFNFTAINNGTLIWSSKTYKVKFNANGGKFWNSYFLYFNLWII